VLGCKQKQVCSFGKLEHNGDIDRARDTVRQNIKTWERVSIGHCESKRCKPRFDEEYSKLVDRKKQAKLQWFQDPNIVNEDNLS
jgi:Fe-S oxidoreductase